MPPKINPEAGSELGAKAAAGDPSPAGHSLFQEQGLGIAPQAKLNKISHLG